MNPYEKVFDQLRRLEEIGMQVAHVGDDYIIMRSGWLYPGNSNPIGCVWIKDTEDGHRIGEYEVVGYE